MVKTRAGFFVHWYIKALRKNNRIKIYIDGWLRVCGKSSLSVCYLKNENKMDIIIAFYDNGYNNRFITR